MNNLTKSELVFDIANSSINDFVQASTIQTQEQAELGGEVHMYGVDDIPDLLGQDGIELYQQYRNTLASLPKFPHDTKGHGKKHCMRVLFLSIMLGKMLDLDKPELKTLASAAIFHDSKRKTDADEPTHGEAAAKYCESVMGKNRTLYFIIKYHSLSDDEARPASPNPFALQMLWILKDADALDRVRFGPRDLNMKYLRFQESKQLSMIASIIYQQSRLSE